MIARRSVLKWGLPAALRSQCIGRVMAGLDEMFDSAGIRLHYVEGGSGDPVILVHGHTMDTERELHRTGVIDALSAHYRTFGLDMRGRVTSEKPHDPAAYGPMMGDNIARLMDRLNLGNGSRDLARLWRRRPQVLRR